MRTDPVNSPATSPRHPYFFPEFFHLNYKIYHIWQFLVLIPVTGFQCHSVLVNSGDCSSEITGISKFRGRSEILAGKFHWNGTRICWNDQNAAGICGASLRPHLSTGRHQVLEQHRLLRCQVVLVPITTDSYSTAGGGGRGVDRWVVLLYVSRHLGRVWRIWFGDRNLCFEILGGSGWKEEMGALTPCM